MRYIVKSNSGDFGEVRVLAETAAGALQVAAEMAERDAPAITIIDADGNVHDTAALELLAANEAAALEPGELRQA